MFSKLAEIISHPNIAVDLGTANTRIYTSLQSKVTELPSSINHVSRTADNISDEYLQFMNNRISTKPLRGGVIIDLRNAIELLKPLVKKSRKLLLAPISLASAPTDTTEKERDLLRKALIMAGASHVSIIPEVWAAAIGAGINITQPHAQLLIDIGDGVTDMAVFCDGRITHSSSIRIACSDFQRVVRSAVMSKYRVQLYDADIEKLTHSIASLSNQKVLKSETFDISGLDIVRRSKIHCSIDKTDIINAIAPVVNKIMMMIELSLKKLPDKTYCEILESGMYLTGGGACIEGMAGLIALRTNMEVKVPSDPIHAVINGAIKTLDNWKGTKCLSINNILVFPA
jgi:rod shape-determining protein MreB and related proteins